MIIDFLADFYNEIIVAKFAILYCMGVATLCLKIPNRAEFTRLHKAYRLYAWSMIIWATYALVFGITNWRTADPLLAQAFTISGYYIMIQLLSHSLLDIWGQPYISRLRTILSGWVLISLTLLIVITNPNQRWAPWVMNIISIVAIADISYIAYHIYIRYKAGDIEPRIKRMRYLLPAFLVWFTVGFFLYIIPLEYIVIYTLCGLFLFIGLFTSYSMFLIDSVVKAPVLMADLTSAGYEPVESSSESTTPEQTSQIIPKLQAIKRSAPVVSRSFNSKSEITTKSIDHLGLPVDKWVEHRGFLKPELTIESMAADIGTNRAYLSAHINNRYKMNFRNWIALIRLEYSRDLLLNDKNLSIIDAAEMVQYSQSSYSTIFKKHYGISPSEWRYNANRDKPNS